MKQSYFLQGRYKESPCIFAVSGQQVKGIVTIPEVQCHGGIIIAHGWSGFRSGPAGILTEYARSFAQKGYATLRFDFRGRGESEGDGLNATLATMADDLVAATHYFQVTYHIQNPSYCGICSGGNVIIGTLKRLTKASHLLLLSVYPFSDGDSFERDIHRTAHFLYLYAHKLLKAETWNRFFKGDVSLKNVSHVLFGQLLHRHDSLRKEGNKHGQQSQLGTLPKAVKAASVESRSQDKTPPLTLLANLRKDVPCIIAYGTADPDAKAAKTYYQTYAKKHDIPLKTTTVHGANHNFSSDQWRKQAFEELANFLKN